MKKIAFLSGLLLIVIQFMVACSESGFITKEIDLHRQVEDSDVRSLLVDSRFSGVDITRHTNGDDSIDLWLQGSVSSKYAKQIDISTDLENEELTVDISVPEGFGNGITFAELVLTLELPEKLFDQIDIRTTHGRINVEGVDAGQVNLKSGAGSIQINNFTADALTFETKAGNVDLSNGEAILRGQTHSGHIKIDFEGMEHNAELETRSGVVTVQLQDRPDSMAVDYQSKAGRGSIELPGFSFDEDKPNLIRASTGEGEVLLKVQTHSGNFNLGP